MSALNCKKDVVLVLLDLSAAFDLDHSILLHRLEYRFGIGGTVLEWFKSYLGGRTQSVCLDFCSSKPSKLIFADVPQGFVLGPILFTSYTA